MAVYCIAGNFRMVQIFAFFVARCKISVDLRLVLACTMDIWHALRKYKQQKESWRRLSSWFLSKAMAKGYQAYRDSWATVLSKEMPCLREVGNWSIFHWREDSAKKHDTQRHGQLPRPAYLKLNPQKFVLKQIQHFREILYPWKFPATQYGRACRKSSDGTGMRERNVSFRSRLWGCFWYELVSGLSPTTQTTVKQPQSMTNFTPVQWSYRPAWLHLSQSLGHRLLSIHLSCFHWKKQTVMYM